VRLHKPQLTQKQGGERPAMPQTALAHAFLQALLNWARRQNHGAALIALPSGKVDGDDLMVVITALVCARRGDR
jgi:hypothetical protein